MKTYIYALPVLVLSLVACSTTTSKRIPAAEATVFGLQSRWLPYLRSTSSSLGNCTIPAQHGQRGTRIECSSCFFVVHMSDAELLAADIGISNSRESEPRSGTFSAHFSSSHNLAGGTVFHLRGCHSDSDLPDDDLAEVKLNAIKRVMLNAR